MLTRETAEDFLLLTPAETSCVIANLSYSSSLRARAGFQSRESPRPSSCWAPHTTAPPPV